MGDESFDYLTDGIGHPTEGIAHGPRGEGIDAVTHVLLTFIESGEVEAGDFPVLDLVLEAPGMDESVIAVVARDARSAVAEVATGARIRDEKGVRWIGKVAVREGSSLGT